jgi:hypothetical protein
VTQRTDALIIYGSIATGQPDDDELAAYGGRPGELHEFVERLRNSIDHWGRAAAQSGSCQASSTRLCAERSEPSSARRYRPRWHAV